MGGRDRIAHLLSTFDATIDNAEKCRRLIDLFLVSVLLDAGAGTEWSFKSADSGKVYRRSEGLAIASLEMFKTVGHLISFLLPPETSAGNWIEDVGGAVYDGAKGSKRRGPRPTAVLYRSY